MKISAKERLELSISALRAYNIEPNIIKSMLSDLEKLEDKDRFCDLYKKQCFVKLCSVTPHPEQCKYLIKT